jgi:hypothetical protein
MPPTKRVANTGRTAPHRRKPRKRKIGIAVDAELLARIDGFCERHGQINRSQLFSMSASLFIDGLIPGTK